MLILQGVWMGMIGGIALQTTMLVFMTCTTNWDEQVRGIIISSDEKNPTAIRECTFGRNYVSIQHSACKLLFIVSSFEISLRVGIPCSDTNQPEVYECPN